MENMGEILTRLATEAAHGEMVFGTHAEMALRVRRALDDPDCSLDNLATLVRAEPLLAARVVAMANSAVYNRSGRSITDIRQAVSTIGFKAMSGLAMALIVRQMEETSKDATIRTLGARLWEHTAHVASLAYVLARRVTRQDPDTAFFAGIVHEVGGFYLISRASSFPGLLDRPLQGWFRSGEVELGRALLKALSVPQQVVDAIEVMALLVQHVITHLWRLLEHRSQRLGHGCTAHITFRARHVALQMRGEHHPRHHIPSISVFL